MPRPVTPASRLGTPGRFVISGAARLAFELLIGLLGVPSGLKLL